MLLLLEQLTIYYLLIPDSHRQRHLIIATGKKVDPEILLHCVSCFEIVFLLIIAYFYAFRPAKLILYFDCSFYSMAKFVIIILIDSFLYACEHIFQLTTVIMFDNTRVFAHDELNNYFNQPRMKI